MSQRTAHRPRTRRAHRTRRPKAKTHPFKRRVASWAQQVKRRLLTPLGKLLSTGSAIAGLAAIFFGLGSHHGGKAQVMTGDLNIAVAAFTTRGASVEGRGLATDAYRALSQRASRLDRTLDVRTLGPGEVGAIPAGSNRAEREQAARLATRTHADLVVYGDLRESATGTTLMPRFYLNPRKLPDAAELGGQYSYGPPIRVPYAISGNPQARALIRDELVRRTTGFASSFVAVGYYLIHDLRRAAVYFKRALPLLRAAQPRSLLLLLLGNIANQRHEPKRAIAYYRSALRARPGYDRAQLGLAEAEYSAAHHSCTRGRADRAGLARARRVFASVHPGARTGGTPSRIVRARIAFGLGQVDVCLSQARAATRWRQAQRELDSVVNAYDASVPELRDEAAEAHSDLGFIDLVAGAGHDRYQQARREYELAKEITTIPARRSYFARMIRFAETSASQRLRARSGANR